MIELATRIAATKKTRAKYLRRESDEDCIEGHDEMVPIHVELRSREDVQAHQKWRAN
jgi:hypothetical protein